jgi:hypothetical protein
MLQGNAVVQIDIHPVYDLMAQGLTYCTWIGTMPIGRNRLWSMPNHSHSLQKKLFGCFHISFFAQPRINQVPIVINGPIEIAPLPLDFQVGLIDVPRSSGLAAPFYP